jgi:hypothetical protein
MLMQSHFSMFGANQMMNNVRAGSVATSIAEPFLANVAHDNSRWLANSTIATAMSRQLLTRNLIIVLLLKLQFIQARRDGIDLAIRDRLRFQLVEAIQLK